MIDKAHKNINMETTKRTHENAILIFISLWKDLCLRNPKDQILKLAVRDPTWSRDLPPMWYSR